jgi:hypothetical protein
MFKHSNEKKSAGHDSSEGSSAHPSQNVEASDKKPSKIKQLWKKLDLDIFTVLLMFKGSLPPIIAIAAFQAPAFSRHFGTLGYLVVSYHMVSSWSIGSA